MSPRAAVLLDAFGFEQVWDYADGKMDWMSRGLPTGGEEFDRMTVGILTVEPALLDLQMNTRDAVKLIDQVGGQAGVVVEGSGTVVGLLTRESADKAGEERVESIMELGPKTYRANGDPEDALEFMRKEDIGQVIVSDPKGKLLGILYRDIVEREVEGEE